MKERISILFNVNVYSFFPSRDLGRLFFYVNSSLGWFDQGLVPPQGKVGCLLAAGTYARPMMGLRSLLGNWSCVRGSVLLIGHQRGLPSITKFLLFYFSQLSVPLQQSLLKTVPFLMSSVSDMVCAAKEGRED